MILENGVIRTMDPQLLTARALAVAGHLIAGGVGVHETALASPEVVDLRRRCVLPGFTDSRWFREAFPDCVAYGFFPQRHMTLSETTPLVHGADERIDVRDLGFAAGFYRDIARELLGG